MNSDKILAAAWLRSSPTIRIGMSIEEQKDAILQRAVFDGVELIKYWEDNNSGIIHLEKNRYFLQMKKDIEQMAVPIKIVYALDRARWGYDNKEQQDELLEYFKKQNIHLQYINENLVSVGAMCRRSTDMQEASIEVQIDSILEYATKYKKEVKKWWIFGEEKGQSGVSIERSKDWKKMQDEIKNNAYNIKGLLIDEVSRLGRTTPNRKIYIQELFKDYGVPITYMQDQFKDDGSLEDGVMQLVKHGAAYQKSKTLSKDVKNKSLVHARRGYWLCGNIYGLKRMVIDSSEQPVLVNGKVLILEKGESKQKREQRVKLSPGDPGEVGTIKKIFDIYNTEETGFYTIAARLNKDGVPSPKGTKWTPTVIRSILTNELYAGTLHYNRYASDSWSGKTTKVPAESQIRVENAHEAILSKELFERVQNKIKKNQGRFRIGHHPNMLKNTPKFTLCGVMFCLECFKKYVSAWTTRKSQKRGEYIQAYYKDSSRRTLGKQGCPNSVTLRKEEIEELVYGRINERLMSKEVIESVRARLKEKLTRNMDSGNIKTKERDLRKELDDVNARIKNLVKVISAQGISEFMMGQIKDEFNQLETRKSSMEDQLSDLKSKCGEEENIDDLCEKIMGYYKEVIGKLKNTPFPGQKKLIRELVHSIAVYPSKKRIYLAFYNLNKELARDARGDDSVIPEPICNQIGPVGINEDFYLKNITLGEHMYQEGKLWTCCRL